MRIVLKHIGIQSKKKDVFKEITVVIGLSSLGIGKAQILWSGSA